MRQYRTALAQPGEHVFVTDGGLETTSFDCCVTAIAAPIPVT
jgi:hypothetical protein